MGWLLVVEDFISTEIAEEMVFRFGEVVAEPVAILPGFIWAGDEPHPTTSEEWDRIRAILEKTLTSSDTI